MKIKELAERGRVNAAELENWLKNSEKYSDLVTYSILGSASLADGANLRLILRDFKAAQAEIAEAAAREKEAARKKQQDLANMLISSGFSFDGYTIVKYSGYISGDDAVQIPRSGFFGDSRTDKNLTDALVQIRRQAIAELKEAAYDLGCNAIIGVDFDYITMDPQTANIHGGTTYEPYVICVTANGNAVIIEKTIE